MVPYEIKKISCGTHGLESMTIMLGPWQQADRHGAGAAAESVHPYRQGEESCSKGSHRAIAHGLSSREIAPRL